MKRLNKKIIIISLLFILIVIVLPIILLLIFYKKQTYLIFTYYGTNKLDKAMQEISIVSNVGDSDFSVKYDEDYLSCYQMYTTFTLTYFSYVEEEKETQIEVIWKQKHEFISITLDKISDEDEHYSYIQQRSFSCSDIEGRQGTCWVVNKVNDDVNDKKYWFATNFHVFPKDTYDRLYLCPSVDKKIAKGNDRYYWPGFKCLEVKNKFEINAGDIDEKKTIDLTIFQLDINDIVDNSNYMNKNFSKRFDNLQKYYFDHNKHINSFADDYSQTTEDEPKYIVGYPSVDNFPTYKSQKFTGSKPEQYTDKSNLNKISDTGFYNIGEFYKFDYTQKIILDHGASGSMTIDENYNVCGIYWGYYSNPGYSCCSDLIVSNSLGYNFIDNYA